MEPYFTALALCFGTLFIFIIVTCLLSCAWVTVSDGNVAIAEYKGVYSRTLASGWHIIAWPLERLRQFDWFYVVELNTGEKVERHYNGPAIFVGVRTYDFPPVVVWSSDRQIVTVNGYVEYSITDAKTAVYSSANPLQTLELTISSSLRNTVATMSYEEAVTAHAKLREVLIMDCKKSLESRGVQVTELRIQSIMPSEEVMKSNELAIATRRNAEAHTILERSKRDAMILASKTESEIKDMQLVAELKRNEETARSFATCLRTRAEAEAASDRVRAQGKKAYADAVGPQFMATEAYTAVLRTVGKRANHTLVLPYEAAQAMGGLNIAQAAFTGVANSAPQTRGSPRRV